MDFSAIKHAASLLRRDQVIGIPTETVYGLGGSARSKKAIQTIYDLKSRPATNPLIIHVSQTSAIYDWAREVPKSALLLAQKFWPGPLTLVLPKHPDVLSMVTANQDTVALRVPSHPVTLALLNEFGEGIAAPSANRSGHISPTRSDHVRAEFGDMLKYILEGGPCQIGIESTIVYLGNSEAILLRPGTITAEDLEDTLGFPLSAPKKGLGETPGSHFLHYAPNQPLSILDETALLDRVSQFTKEHTPVAVLAFRNHPLFQENEYVYWIQAEEEALQYAHSLYHHLRLLDTHTPTPFRILIEAPPRTPAFEAVWDRLQRASGKKPSKYGIDLVL